MTAGDAREAIETLDMGCRPAMAGARTLECTAERGSRSIEGSPLPGMHQFGSVGPWSFYQVPMAAALSNAIWTMEQIVALLDEDRSRDRGLPSAPWRTSGSPDPWTAPT
jgi:hypothetical protein